jgi:hypothetical protein
MYKWINISIAIYLFLFGFSCAFQKRELTISLENSSSVNRKIVIETLLGVNTIDKREVVKGENVVNFESFNLALPNNTDSVCLQFKVLGTNYVTKCNFLQSQIKKRSWVHVNFSEVLFRKGYKLFERILDKDTVIERRFYCELMN